MSILTINDLRIRSNIDPTTGCWHFTGSLSRDGVPRIHTLDYERDEKRVMSGPKAVWNIAHCCAPRAGWLVFRRCVTADCVNPVHMGQAASRKEIGAHIRLNGARKGVAVEQRQANLIKARAAAGIVPTSEPIVISIRAADTDITSRALSKLHGIAEQTVSRIRRGQSHRHLLPTIEAGASQPT